MSTGDKVPDELEGTEQPFVSHLIELRDRLIRASIAVGVCFGILALWPGPSGLYDLLAAPLVANLPKGTTLIATSVISPFLVPVTITLMAAFLLALPVVLYQVWAFVAPGLYTHEKRLVMPLVISSTLLFFVGVGFCYFFVFGQVFKFIQSFAPKSITAAAPPEDVWKILYDPARFPEWWAGVETVEPGAEPADPDAAIGYTMYPAGQPDFPMPQRSTA